MVNLPALLTSFVPTAARLARAFLQSAAFRPVAVASAAVRAPWDIAAAAFMAFGAILRVCLEARDRERKSSLNLEPM